MKRIFVDYVDRDAINGCGMRLGKIAAFTLMFAVSACGPSQAEKAKIEEQRVAKIKADEDQKRSVCGEVIEVTEAFFRESGSLSDDAERSLSGRVSQAAASYNQSIRYDIITGEDVERQYNAHNNYISAMVSAKKAKIAVLSEFVPLSKELSAYAHASKVASAGGAVLGAAEQCREARRLVDLSLDTASRLEKRIKSVSGKVSAQREVLEAADKRLKAALGVSLRLTSGPGVEQS